MYGTLEKYLIGDAPSSDAAVRAIAKQDNIVADVMGASAPGNSHMRALLVHARKQSAMPP